MTDSIFLRRRVRMILSALPAHRRASEQLLFDKLKPDLPDLRADELQIALSENHSKGFTDFIYNGDEERREWFLTPEGRQKEGVA